MCHYHVKIGRLEHLVRELEEGQQGKDCGCEAGELDLFHEECQEDATPEDCPCPTCQRQRWKRFGEWQQTWARGAAAAGGVR